MSVAKLVDAADLKSADFGLAGSTPAARTTLGFNDLEPIWPLFWWLGRLFFMH